MNTTAWVDPRVERVSAEQVRGYLLARGWRLQAYPGPELLVFRGPDDDDGEPILQVLPSSPRLKDFRTRLVELIAALSVLEQRPAGDILNDILQVPPAGGTAASDQFNGAEAPVSHPQQP